MEFEYITLTQKEYARLKKLSKSPSGLPTAPHETNLVNNRLISRTRYGSPEPDSETTSTSMSSITQEGKNYLKYRKHRKHDFLIATYGIIGGIISGVVSSLIVLWLQGLL